MILERTPLAEDQQERFRQKGVLRREIVFPQYHDHELVCNCMQITRGELSTAIEGGCRRVDDLMEVTGASTVCGSCRPLLQEMVGQAIWIPVAIAEVLPVAEGVRSFRLKSYYDTLKPAKPGQHLLIQAYIDGRWVQRPYTISSAANETSYREITVKRETNGFFSGWLHEPRWDNTPIRISEAQGDYFVDLSEKEPIVCLVGGIGMTPALAICRSIRQEGGERKLFIDYSVSTRDQFAYADELKAAATANKNISIKLRATKEDGRLSPGDIEQLNQQYPAAHYYLCGPSAYQNTAETYLKDARIPQERIHIEVFTPVGDKPPEPAKGYFYLGLSLLAAFAVQDLFQLKWPWLQTLQAGDLYRIWTGFFLAFYMLGQFIFPALRWQGRLKAAARHYHLHKYQGAFAPLVYYIHTTTMGYAYLLMLSTVFFGNFILGLFNQEIVAKPAYKRQYSYYWLIVHVILSFLTMALIAYHLYVVFAYQ